MRGHQNANDNTNESRILNHIKDNPGIHLRRIKGDLGYSMGTIQYFLINWRKKKKLPPLELDYTSVFL